MTNAESTLSEFLSFWNTEECTPDISVFTRRKRAHLIQKCILPHIGNIMLNKIQPKHIVFLRNQLIHDSISSSQQNDVLLILQNALQYAERQNLILDSFHQSFHTSSVIVPVPVYTSAQVQKIFQALRFDPLCNFYKLVYYTLMENMELKALRVSDISLRDHRIAVLQEIRSTPHKSLDVISAHPCHRRQIQLSTEAEHVIIDELEKRETKRKDLHWEETEEDYLFVHCNGRPYKYIDPKGAALQVRASAGIENFSTRSLRLTAVSIMLENGVSPVTIKNILGIDRLRELKRMEIQVHI